MSLKMLSVALPCELNETLVTQIGLSEPDWLRYGFLSSRLLGLSWTGDWLTLGPLLPADLLLFGAVEATETASGEFWFEPVSIPEAVQSPIRFDFLADPVVSISLAANIGGALAYMLIAGKEFAIPSGSTAEIRGREYPIGAGIAVCAMEATYRSAWAGIAEEAFYRGYLLPELVEYLGPVAGIALNTAAFMLVHYSPGTDLLSWFLTYAPPSITFAMLSFRSDFDFISGRS